MNNSDQIKTSLGIKILITFIVYLNLIIIASIIFYIFSKLNSPLEQRWMYDLAESFYMIFIIGIVGVLPTISGASPIFLFPFLPCIITLVITFIIVHLLEINQIITRNKKTFLSIVALCLIGIVILFINDQLVKVRHKIKMEEDMKIYSTEYFSEYPIQSKFRFIYPDKNKIIISDLNGNKKEVLSEISMDEEHATIGYVSPKGTYYMIINPESVRLFDTANNIFKQDLCNQIEFIKDCPISCKWAPDESSFLCQYERYSKKSKKDTRDLVLFDPVSGNHKNIYYQKDAYEIDYIKQYEGFTFVNNNSLIFSDHKNLFFTENIKEFLANDSMLEVKKNHLNNLTGCNDPIYFNNQLFCAVKSTDVNIKIENSNNFYIHGEDFFLISQKIDQSKKMDFTVTNKAPLGNPNKEPTIYPIDDQFFWIMPPFGGANFILLIDSGKFKNYDSLMEKSFIFPERIDGYGERKEIESTIPKIYIGS